MTCSHMIAGNACPAEGVRFIRPRWNRQFPDVFVHCSWASGDPYAITLKSHRYYEQAKRGADAEAALDLVQDLVSEEALDAIEAWMPDRPLLVCPHPNLTDIKNRIPLTLTEVLSGTFDIPVDENIYQSNLVHRTSANSWGRLANQPTFAGTVRRGADYVIVDDVYTFGGTIANLRAYILANGGNVTFATCLAHKHGRDQPIALAQATAKALINRYGKPLDNWWLEEIGHDSYCLTEPEAQFLGGSGAPFDRIRGRICQARGCAGAAGATWAD